MSLWNVTSNQSHDPNILIKYADDTNLLVPEHTDGQLNEDFGGLAIFKTGL